MARVERPRPQFGIVDGAGGVDGRPQDPLRLEEVSAHARRKIVALQLPLQPGGEQSLLPRPYDSAVVGVAAESRLQRRRAEGGIGDQHPCVGHQARGKRTRQPGDGPVDLFRIQVCEQQRKSLIRMHDRDRLSRRIERDRMEAQILGAQGCEGRLCRNGL